MLHLKDERKVRLFEIIGTEETEVKKVLKTILKEYEDVVFQGAHDIGNYQTIKHIIRLLDETLVVGK